MTSINSEGRETSDAHPPLPKDMKGVEYESCLEDFYLQPHPRLAGWPALSAEQRFWMKGLQVDITKSVDQNLSVLL